MRVRLHYNKALSMIYQDEFVSDIGAAAMAQTVSVYEIAPNKMGK